MVQLHQDTTSNVSFALSRLLAGPQPSLATMMTTTTTEGAPPSRAVPRVQGVLLRPSDDFVRSEAAGQQSILPRIDASYSSEEATAPGHPDFLRKFEFTDPILATAGEGVATMMNRTFLCIVFLSFNLFACITDRDVGIDRDSAMESGTDDATSSTQDETSTTSSASEESGNTLDSTSSAETTGTSEPQQLLCESSGGEWNLDACGHSICGVPVECDAVDPGCNCGLGSVFVDGEGCVDDETCESIEFECAGTPCVAPDQYCDVWGASISCDSTPPACQNSYTCACLGPKVGGTCETQEDGSIFVYVPGGL